MKTRIFLLLLAFACLLNAVKSQCDLGGRAKDEKDFPDIMKNVGASYIMGIERSNTKEKRIDYYVEYYDAINKKGRVDVHAEGENVKYMYHVNTWEQWLITNSECKFQLINESLVAYDNTFLHYENNSVVPTTIGPSSALKRGFDAWNARKKGDNTIAYMGKAKGTIRGEEAEYWRHCAGGKNYTDYYFAVSYEENPSDSEFSTVTPLRVSYYYDGYSEFYDFMSFQRFIPAGTDPFQLPIGMNCRRSHLVPETNQPDFSNKNIYLSSEVLYRKFSLPDDRNIPMSSYYSTLTFALDRQTSHLSYTTAAWNSTKKDEEDQDPKQYPAERIVYDTKKEYFYNMSLETGRCGMGRIPSFYPQYMFPNGSGSIAVTDPYVFLPNNELKFFTEGKVRGLDVNFFELEVTDLLLTDDVVHKAIVTHAYLKPYVEEENTVAVKQAPVLIELRLYRDEKTLEVLTFNVFGFTTLLKDPSLFDISSCYRNDDDYTYMTLGFEIEDKYLKEVQNELSQIKDQVVEQLGVNYELSALRLPSVQIVMKKDYVYVTFQVLERPPLQLDFTNTTDNQTIEVSSEDDKQGVSSFKTCALNCLEERRDCWGFSRCGETCFYGSSENTKTKEAIGCKVFTKYTNKSSIASKASIIQNLLGKVSEGEFSVSVALKDEELELTATFAQETDPAEDDSLFEKMGNYLNSRMTVVRAGATLKQGTRVQNLGRLRYDECQSLCLDYQDCETAAYCVTSTECKISTTYADDLDKETEVEDNMLCNLLAKKYSAHFDRAPGVMLKGSGGKSLDISDMEGCARACLKESQFDCLSFDHCSGKDGCTLYKVHYLDPKERKENTQKNARCGHYSRQLSADFKKNENIQIQGSNVPSLYNLTVEECAKSCVEYGSGVCYGYDFCQDGRLLATKCTLFDTDPSRLKSTYSATCTHFARTAPEFAPRPFTNSYAGGIGFLCFLVGVILGGGVIFVLYKRMNRG